MDNTSWADRGQQLRIDTPVVSSQASCIGVSRLGSMQMPAGTLTIWLQLRGSSWVEGREGRFRVRRGDWIAFDRDSKPLVQADRHGVCVGLSLGDDALRAAGALAQPGLYAGRGHIELHDARMALRLWRASSRRLATVDGDDAIASVAALRPLLLQLALIQSEITAGIPRCPGRSRARKRQVFGRLQRAHMYLDGNRDRIVRISELAELTSYSSWYFSKTYHALYGESPQSASARMRIERAAELLGSSQMMIGEVAAASGFENCCSFARAFRARYQMSATTYRKRMAA
ncbi:helix-turn-helix domain-containing protein [Lysobacter sp. A289]